MKRGAVYFTSLCYAYKFSHRIHIWLIFSDVQHGDCGNSVVTIAIDIILFINIYSSRTHVLIDVRRRNKRQTSFGRAVEIHLVDAMRESVLIETAIND